MRADPDQPPESRQRSEPRSASEAAGRTLVINGTPVGVGDEAASLLDVLRSNGVTSVKDGCSPQGQCGCCTVLVDGQARVSCVTPVRRVLGRSVVTTEGLDPEAAQRWANAFVSCGASQCGFCTPGIVLRLEAMRTKDPGRLMEREPVCRALSAHLCRCTGWNTIVDAAAAGSGPAPAAAVGDVEAASRRASLETGGHQRLGADVVLGRAPAGDGGFGADTAPDDALVAIIGTDGEWVVGETLAEARRLAGRVQGRRTTVESRPPIDLPPGDWAVTLQTSWVEPAYLETDASWCEPGGEPASPLANGGAFGGKVGSPIPAVARRLADEHGRSVLVLWSREESVRLGPKRPPIAAGVRTDGTGIVRVARAPGIAAAIGAVLGGVTVEEVDLAGPPTSAALRAAGRAEAIALAVAADIANPVVTLDGEVVRIAGSEGGVVAVRLDDEAIHVDVDAGDPLDVTAVRSYCVGAAHMATSWVTSEALSIGVDGEVGDLTIRSFDILRAIDTPPVVVTVTASDRPAVRVSDDVFAAVAAAVWRRQGRPPIWPTRSRGGLPVR